MVFHLARCGVESLITTYNLQVTVQRVRSGDYSILWSPYNQWGDNAPMRVRTIATVPGISSAAISNISTASKESSHDLCEYQQFKRAPA